MADDAGLEMHRAQRDSVMAPVLKANGFRLKRDYFLRNFDYNDDEIEEVEEIDNSATDNVAEETMEEQSAEPIAENQQLADTGEDKASVRNRSVADS